MYILLYTSFFFILVDCFSYLLYLDMFIVYTLDFSTSPLSMPFILYIYLVFLCSLCVALDDIFAHCLIACCMTTFFCLTACLVCLCRTHMYPLISNSLVSINFVSIVVMLNIWLETCCSLFAFCLLFDQASD